MARPRGERRESLEDETRRVESMREGDSEGACQVEGESEGGGVKATPGAFASGTER